AGESQSQHHARARRIEGHAVYRAADRGDQQVVSAEARLHELKGSASMGSLLQRPVGRRTILKQGVGLLVAPLILPRIGLKAASDRTSVASSRVGVMGNRSMQW